MVSTRSTPRQRSLPAMKSPARKKSPKPKKSPRTPPARSKSPARSKAPVGASVHACKKAHSKNWLDDLVLAVAPADKSAVASVDTLCIVLFCAGMVVLTRGPLQLRATVLLLLNVFVRLLYPSAYYPATASVPGVVASPVTARCIAFVAEFALYEVWAVWVGVDFWGPSHLWLVVGFGEVISTTGVLLQNELLLNIEDSTWTAHALYMLYLSYPQPLPVVLFGAFGGHMLFSHLPRRFKLMLSGGRAKQDSLLHCDPLLTTGKIVVRRCEHEEKAWVVPMLLGQPLLMALMYWQINH